MNDRKLYIDIDKLNDIFNRKFEDISEEDWKFVQKFKLKLSTSTSFAHKVSKQLKDLL